MNIKTIAATHLLLFLVLLMIHVGLFHYPIPIIFNSLLVISTIYSILLWSLFLAGLLKRKESKAYSLITATSFTIVTSSLVMVFIIDYVGNSNWSTNFTIEYIIKYAMQLKTIKDSLPLPIHLIYLLIAFFVSIVFIYYMKTSSVILTYIEDTKLKSFSIRKFFYVALSFLIIPMFFLTYYATQDDDKEDMWDGEPITDLFLPSVRIAIKEKNYDPLEERTYEINTSNIKNKPNIILIIADALRADHVGAYGYDRLTTPFLDQLIKDNKAIKIENAFSTCSESNCGILSTLSSRPYSEITPTNLSINYVLKSLGYDINFILSTDHTWAGLKKHYPPYDVFYDGNDAVGKFAMTDDELVLDRLSSIKEYNNPSFFYFHLMSNHTAGIRKRQFEKFTPSKNSNDWFYRLPLISKIFNTNEVSLETNFYDNGIVATDYYISKIFEQLSRKGYLKNSIIWIIADHGEAIGEHGEFGHIKSLYNEEVRIPMIIVDNKLELYKERNFATQLDYAPSILDRLGVEAPRSWKGTSLLTKKTGTHISHHNVPDREGNKAIIVKTDNNQIFKMLYNDTNSFKITAIYNLSKDKAEENNLNKTGNQSLINKMTNYALKKRDMTQIITLKENPQIQNSILE